MTFTLHSRIALAAVIAPLAVLATACGNNDGTPADAAADPTTSASSAPTTPASADAPAAIDYVEGRTWHQADGDEVPVPAGDYEQAGVWDGNLVLLQRGTEVFPSMEVFDADGNPVGDPQQVAGFAISADQTILAYTTADGQLITQWDGGRSVLARDVTDSAGGESSGGGPASVIGTAPCKVESGRCLVRVNTATSGCRGIGSDDVPLPTDAAICFDEQDGLLSETDKIRDDGVTCGGVWSGYTFDFLWHSCDVQAQDISPNGKYVVGAPSQYDGLGYTSISILDTKTGKEQPGRFAPEGGFIWSDVAWTADNRLLFSTYDGAQWHLFAMAPNGATDEVGEPVAGPAENSPFTLIAH